jgi:hypothetical protein
MMDNILANIYLRLNKKSPDSKPYYSGINIRRYKKVWARVPGNNLPSRAMTAPGCPGAFTLIGPAVSHTDHKAIQESWFSSTPDRRSMVTPVKTTKKVLAHFQGQMWYLGVTGFPSRKTVEGCF